MFVFPKLVLAPVFVLSKLVLAPVFVPPKLVLAPVFVFPKLVLVPVVVPPKLLLVPVVVPFGVTSPLGVPVNVKTLVLGVVVAAGLVVAGFETELAALLPLPETSSALHKFSKLRVTPR